ncbi:MAG: response regulator [Ignavibacteriales bacterium]
MALNSISVLLIEDNLGEGKLVSETIHEENWMEVRVEQAFRLSTGIERLKTGKYDVILLDLNLPDSYGLSTLTKLLNEEQNTPIVILTGLEDEDLGMEAVKLGAQDYLVKYQIDGRSLIRSICYAIERKRASGRWEKINL